MLYNIYMEASAIKRLHSNIGKHVVTKLHMKLQ